MDAQLKQFIYHKNGWPLPTTKPKPTVGKLTFVYCGKETILFENKPFAFLQSQKKLLSCDPHIIKGKLKISY